MVVVILLVAYRSNITYVESITSYYFPKDNISLKKKWIAQVKRTRDKWSGPTAQCCVVITLVKIVLKKGSNLARTLELKIEES